MTEPPADLPPPPYGQQPALPPPPPPPPFPGYPPTTSYPAHWSQDNLPSPYYPSAQPGTNGFAIASLVFGIIGGCLLAVIFGIIALRQIGRTGQKGKGMAIAGLVLTGVWVLVGIGVVALSGLDDAGRDTSTGQITDNGDVPTTDLRIGDCVNGLKNGAKMASIEGIACSDAHEGEVFALIDLDGSAYPGDSALRKQATTECFAALEDEHPRAYDDERVGVFYLRPTRSSWSRGDRQLTCLVEYETRRAGSIDDAYVTSG